MQMRQLIEGVVITSEQAAAGLIGGATGALITNHPVTKMALITATGYGLFNAFGRKLSPFLPSFNNENEPAQEQNNVSFGEFTTGTFVAHSISFMFGMLAYRLTKTDTSDLTGNDTIQNMLASFPGAYIAGIGLTVLTHAISKYLSDPTPVVDQSQARERAPRLR